MDPIYEINRQFAHYVLLDTHMLQMLKNKLWSNYYLENKIKNYTEFAIGNRFK